jgi:hypothetical protein
MSATNTASFWRAHEDYYRIPDDRDYDEYQCEDCLGTGSTDPDEDTGRVTKCSSCGGTGHLTDDQIDAKIEDAREYAEECKAEAYRERD